MLLRKLLRFSFCGKKETEVSKLVAGPKVYICDECVAVAARILQGETPSNFPVPRVSRSLIKKLKGRFHQFVQKRVWRDATVASAP